MCRFQGTKSKEGDQVVNCISSTGRKKNELVSGWRNSSVDKYLIPGTEGRAVCKVDSASCGVNNGVRGFWG